jgi:hypothetical protein
MRAKDAFLLTPHRSLRRCRCMIPAAEVKGAVDGEEAHLIGNGVLGLSIRPPATFARLFNRPIHTDHNVAERHTRPRFRRANRATARAGRTSDARARWVFMWIKEWKAEHIRWTTFPHVRFVQRCNRRIIHKGECHFAMRGRVRCAKCAHNECGEFG